MKGIVLSKNAQIVGRARYFINGNENWEGCVERCGSTIATPETKKSYYTEKFIEMIYNMFFIPGGRILRNCERPRGSLFNCYHLPCGDSIEEIGQFLKDALILWSDGGGVGANFSQLRPKGDKILGKGGTSSGAVSFIKAANSVALTVESGGSRRAAALGSLDVSHPEIIDFINAKLLKPNINQWLRDDTPQELSDFVRDKIDTQALSHFNISVSVDNNFLEAVEADKEWEFKFKQKSYNKMPAREIWQHIITNMVKCAEPGLLNWSNLSKNNSYYFDPVSGCNPCGEAILSPYDVCCLGSLVLPKFITGTINTNWKLLEEIIRLAIRFLDDVIEVNKYSLRENDIKAHNNRRIGLGVMGLSEYLFSKKITYGSQKALNEIERLFKFIRDTVYDELVQLSMEKGAFPKFDPVAYGKASFIRKLPASLRRKIKEHGVRCVTGLAIAPTGTISLLPEVTSAIEPLFAKAYIRSDRVSDRIYVHPLYKKMLENNEVCPEWFVDANDLSPEDHLETQAIVQKYIDGAVSKTVNLPSNTTPDQLDKLLLEYIYDLKGVTVYVDGSRGKQIYNKIDEKEIIEYLKKNKIESTLTSEEIGCANGKCAV